MTGPLPYRVLTGPDDATFCERVSAALADGYELHGSPALTFDGDRVVVAQALTYQAVDRARVVGYDDRWPDRARALIAELADSLGPRALRIDHIGSTAIAGMAAKDLLDLQVSVAALDPAAKAFDEPLARLGFARTPFQQDHVPAGSADAPDRWAKRYWHRHHHPAGDVNLHVRVAGAPNERLALLFRDWFRAHPAAVPAYASFKRVLADSVADRDAYTDVKDPVVDLVVGVAEQWAADTGWQP
ncbi:GrpB family protein [Hamadaea tsunoensis]|uniref:GrpB family protein n=1 Tax=Hamadaea tsunoensis TaxID=53368 RepID=UPI001FE0D7F0|nr:GrpB family protein [Hamadaea tsunoensis]